jgi:hypothetical protein
MDEVIELIYVCNTREKFMELLKIAVPDFPRFVRVQPQEGEKNNIHYLKKQKQEMQIRILFFDYVKENHPSMSN